MSVKSSVGEVTHTSSDINLRIEFNLKPVEMRPIVENMSGYLEHLLFRFTDCFELNQNKT